MPVQDESYSKGCVVLGLGVTPSSNVIHVQSKWLHCKPLCAERLLLLGRGVRNAQGGSREGLAG